VTFKKKKEKDVGGKGGGMEIEKERAFLELKI